MPGLTITNLPAREAKHGGTMERRPLLGDEAIALGAIHAGLSGAYSYPGTPATEIFEFVHRETHNGPPVGEGGVHAVWSANEKVAYEEALGMSYAGRRALVSFKHVGLNVAADPFMNSGVSGVDGGLLVCSADDPGMHSSQNEQDSRIYAWFAMIPAVEPCTGQEAYEMTREGYELSEKLRLPIMIRMVTRLAHSRSGVELAPRREPNPLRPSERPADWTLLPANARRLFASLAEKQADMLAWSESCRWNQLKLNPKSRKLGIIAAGVAYNYVCENYGDGAEMPSILKIGAYPIPKRLVRELIEAVDEVLVLEDGYPFIEGQIVGLLGAPKPIHGRLDGAVPRTGELNPDIVRKALGMPAVARQSTPTVHLPARPPRLCDGCPHIDSYQIVREIMDELPETRVFGDIGCYTLGAYPPYQTIHSCIDMGASISMAMGAAQAGMRPVLCTIGDSTFIHSGMTPLIGAAQQNTPMTVFILDNSTTAMTGGQDSMADGVLANVVKGLGVDPEHVHVLQAHRKFHDQNLEIIRREVAYEGLSVIIPTRECVVTAKKK
ncbi:MAG TPA: thiamine pyrophosphate-dependent enzyme [Polyangiaceae bacterium]|nr:thiamine pyrophosphate-dependent enzyme [Polyangiaceae bacterium]